MQMSLVQFSKGQKILVNANAPQNHPIRVHPCNPRFLYILRFPWLIIFLPLRYSVSSAVHFLPNSSFLIPNFSFLIGAPGAFPHSITPPLHHSNIPSLQHSLPHFVPLCLCAFVPSRLGEIQFLIPHS